MDHWTNGNGPMDQWTNGPMDQRTNGPKDQWANGPTDQWTNPYHTSYVRKSRKEQIYELRN